MNDLFSYLALHYCPHDIVSKDFVYAWTNDKCEHFSKEYKNFKACFVCWDCFITEILRDLPRVDEVEE